MKIISNLRQPGDTTLAEGALTLSVTELINTSMHLINTESVRQTLTATYILGLLAMIKCSICSYQCDNWYVFNWRLACNYHFLYGLYALGLHRH